MSVTIDGAFVTDLALKKEREAGTYALSGSYELLTRASRVVAKQSFGGYGNIVVPQSRETATLITKLLLSLQGDIENHVGICHADEEPKVAANADEIPF